MPYKFLCGLPMGIKFLQLEPVLKTKDSTQKSSVKRDSVCALLGARIIPGDVRAKASLISFQQDTDCTPIKHPTRVTQPQNTGHQCVSTDHCCTRAR